MSIRGPDARDPQGQAELWVAPGSHYGDPAFSWVATTAPTSIAFIESAKLGCERLHDIVVGDTNCGQLYHLRPNAARDGLDFADPDLQDLVADNTADRCTAEQAEIVFGTGFGIVTDIETGPDGALYVASLTNGAIYRIAADLPLADDADADEVEDLCDCDIQDPGAWAEPAEVPRLRLSKGVLVQLGWNDQRAAAGTATVYDVVTGSLDDLRADGGFASACTYATGLTVARHTDGRALLPGQGVYYLVRARNGCGNGTFGDAGGVPDPRDALDAAPPASCP